MIGIYIMLGGMVLFATVIGVWDLVGQKRRRREIPRRATNPESPISNPQE